MTTYENIASAQQENIFLQTLGESASQNLLSHMNLVLLPQGKILQEPSIGMRYVYFPTTCIVALLCGVENGAMTQIACIGKEGMVGVLDILSDEISRTQIMVQSTGYAYRIRAYVMRDELQTNSALQTQCMRYLHTLMSEMAQTATCIRHHTLVQQLCSWFLQCLDRLPSNELVITQEFISHMLGVRREGVTAAARKLQNAGIIAYRRGRISIMDREALEQQACECYQHIQRGQQRQLPLQSSNTLDAPLVIRHWKNKSAPQYANAN